MAQLTFSNCNTSTKTINVFHEYFGNWLELTGLNACLGFGTTASFIRLGVGFVSCIVSETCLLISVCLYYKNLDVFLEIAHAAIIGNICLVEIIVIIVNASSFIKLYEYTAENYFEYEGDIPGAEEIVRHGKKIKRLWKKYFPGFVYFVGIYLATFMPTFNYLFPTIGNENLQPNPLLPIKIWTPFDSYSVIPFIAIYVSQCILIIYICSVFAVTTTVFTGCGEDLCTQLKILRLAFKTLADRARVLFREKGNYEYQTLEEALYCCFKDNVKHHIIILECMTHFKRTSSAVMLYIFLNGGIMLATHGYYLSQEGLNLEGLIKAVIFLGGELTVLYAITWYGERLKEFGEGVREELYNCDWETWPKVMRSSALIVFEVVNRPIIIQAGGIVPATRETFSNILNAGYSYYNVIQAFKS